MKVAIVGIGNMGSKYINKFVELGYETVLIDIEDYRLAKYPENFKKYKDLNQALDKEDIQALFVATSPTSHIPIAKKAIERGINVLIEKPPALSSKELEEAINLAIKKNVYLHVSEIELQSSIVRNLKLHKKPSGIKGFRLNLGKGYINPFYDLAWHDLYIFQYLIGDFKIKSVKDKGNIFEVYAISDNTEFDLEVAWLNPFVRREWLLDENIKLNFVEDSIYHNGNIIESDKKDKLKLMIQNFINNPSFESSFRALKILKEIENIKI